MDACFLRELAGPTLTHRDVPECCNFCRLKNAGRGRRIGQGFSEIVYRSYEVGLCSRKPIIVPVRGDNFIRRNLQKVGVVGNALVDVCITECVVDNGVCVAREDGPERSQIFQAGRVEC